MDVHAPAAVSTPSGFYEGGRWAAEKLLGEFKKTGNITPQALRTADLLSQDQWKAFDEIIVQESIANIQGVAALISRGLTINVPNAMGRTILQWQKVSDMNDAEVQLSGLARTEDDALEFDVDGVPLPIIHKDFNINLRTETASRLVGPFGSNPLDTQQAEVAGRKVGEKLEDILYNGLAQKYGGLSVYGFLTAPNVNTSNLSDWGASATTGDTIVNETITMITALRGKGFRGPYLLHVAPLADLHLDTDFKANSDLTIRQRLLQFNSIAGIVSSDKLAEGKVVLHQATRDVVAIAQGEPVQTIQWDMYGGFQHAFKVFTIQVPVIRSTRAGKSGIYVGT